MKLFAALFFVLTLGNAYALEAVVTVLETPMLRFRSYESPVVQYLRKGDVIKIHPSVANDPEMNKYAPAQEKLAKVREAQKATPEYNEDKLFRGEEENTFFADDEFIPVVDRLGNRAYIISRHIYIYFNDARELDQTITSADPTDYRLEEPLPRKYPLKSLTGIRGQLLLGITQPNYESYNYRQGFRTKGYSSPLELNYTLLKQAPGDYREKLFIGATAAFRQFQNSYTFLGGRLSEELGFRFGLGPTISYEAFKTPKDRLNISGTIIVNFFDRIYIQQKLDTRREDREYVGYSVSPRVALQYHRKQIYDSLDFVIGTFFEVTPPTTYRSQGRGLDREWWEKVGKDSFSTNTAFTLGGYLGIQSTY